MHTESDDPIAVPQGSMGCCPCISRATPIEFELYNSAKMGNFIDGTLQSVVLRFLVANQPKTDPQTGCPGTWMFQQMMAHFGPANVRMIEAFWYGGPGASDNLDELNRGTAGGAVKFGGSGDVHLDGKAGGRFWLYGRPPI